MIIRNETLSYAWLFVFQVPVWAVLDYTDTKTINRELLLVKVSILGPEYLADQLVGGPSHDPRNLISKLFEEILRNLTNGYFFFHPPI